MKDRILREGTRLWKALKRSVKKDRDRWIKGAALAVLLLVVLLLVRSCACGSKKPKEVDEAAQGVMTITVAPSPTPTEMPRQVDSSAVASSGNVTMVNEYLVQKSSGEPPRTDEAGTDEAGTDEISPQEETGEPSPEAGQE